MSSLVFNVSSFHTQAFSITLLLMCLPSPLCGIFHYNSINVPSFHTLALSITSFLVCLSSSLWHSPFHCFYHVRPLWRSLLHHCEHVFCPHSRFLQDIVIVSSICFSGIHCYIVINISSILTPASLLHHSPQSALCLLGRIKHEADVYVQICACLVLSNENKCSF